jgi:hypothetical protein
VELSILFLGSATNNLFIKSLASGLIFSQISPSKLKSAFLIFSYTSPIDLAKNGSFPLSKVYAITPRLQQSQSIPYSFSSIISGATYKGVPLKVLILKKIKIY